MKFILLAVVLVLALGTPAALFFLSSQPAIELSPVPQALGAASTVNVKVTSPHGAEIIRLRLVQGQAVFEADQTQSRNRWTFWRKHLAPAAYSLVAVADPAKGFKSGPASLTVETVANDFRGLSAVKIVNVPIVLEAPKVSADGMQHYVNQGGSELVTFTAGGFWTEAGVRVGKREFRSFPMPGAKNENERFCLFAFPWDEPESTVPVVFVRNAAGQEAVAHFWMKLFPKKFRQRELDLNDAFIDKAISEIDPGGSGDRMQRFLKVNGELRKQNNQTLAGLRNQSEQKFLWSPPFQQLSNSKVEAFFADVRTYMYQGRKVDQQVHLGFDLSKTQAADVVASNSGKIVWADRLGIYGNCVVVDHGYGLQSIYGHLSSIGVKKGDMVQRGGLLGKSGATGLAGGDHLHFSMQVDGVQINPVEWWDPHWIHDRILSKLPASAIEGGAAGTAAAAPAADQPRSTLTARQTTSSSARSARSKKARTRQPR